MAKMSKFQFVTILKGRLSQEAQNNTRMQEALCVKIMSCIVQETVMFEFVLIALLSVVVVIGSPANTRKLSRAPKAKPVTE